VIDAVGNALQQVSSQPLGLLLALALGTLSAITGCCTLPALGVMVGYSGTQENADRKTALKKALFFILGIIVSLIIIGGVAGFVGKVANAALGRYWTIFAGVLLIFLGLANLRMLPFKLSFRGLDNLKNRLGMSGVILTGFILGGLLAVSSLCCNPVTFVVVGVAILQKHIFQAILLLGMFAIGFSLPLGVVLIGVSLGKDRFMPKNAEKIVRWVAGGILLIAGFYFLITF